MPLGTVVLRDKHRLWPCEVNPPLLSVPVDDDVLEFGQRKPAVDEYQPCFAFHGGFCSPVGVFHEFADVYDAPSALLIAYRARQMFARAGADMQCGIECRQGSRP